MARTKIIFVVIDMNVGGTEKALLNMLHAIPKDAYDVTVLMLQARGGFLEHIPDWVTVRELEGYQAMKAWIHDPPPVVLKSLLRRGKAVQACVYAWLQLLSRIQGERTPLYRYLLRRLPVLTGYDLAVAYAGPMEFISCLVDRRIRSAAKAQWIHFDVANIAFNAKFASKTYRAFDRIFVVSDEGKRELIRRLPEHADRIETFQNVLSERIIMKMADEGEGFNDSFQGTRILTVGRLSREKGQDLAIPVLARLRREGFDVRWYCIGEGPARAEYEKLIAAHGVEEDFVLLGAMTNPYPYMKGCDIYVQPSRHEGYAVALAEARCLRRPIVTTNFASAFGQIRHGHTGFIAQSEDELFHAIRNILVDKTLAHRMMDNLGAERVETQDEVDKLFALCRTPVVSSF